MNIVHKFSALVALGASLCVVLKLYLGCQLFHHFSTLLLISIFLYSWYTRTPPRICMDGFLTLISLNVPGLSLELLRIVSLFIKDVHVSGTG